MEPVKEINKTREPDRIICKNPDCRLFNQEINPLGDQYFDPDLGRVIKFGNNCPACKQPFIHIRDNG